MAGLKDRSLLLSVDDPFQFNLVSFAQFVPLIGTFGVSLTRIPTSPNTLDKANFAIGRKLRRTVSMGGSINIEKLGDDLSASADLGFFLGNPRVGTLENRWRMFDEAKLWDKLNLAVTVQNIPLYENATETAVLIGASYLLPATGLLLNTGYHLFDGRTTKHAGLGLEINDNITLYSGLDDLDFDRWAFGFGYTHDNFILNLTYSKPVEQFLLTLSARIGPDPASFAEPYYNRAAAYARAGNYKMASKEFKKYLAFDVVDARTDSVRKLVYFLDRRIAKTEMKVDSLFQVSRRLLSRAEPQFLRAALILTKIKELDPTNTRASKQLLALKPAVDIFVKRSIQSGIDKFEAHDYAAAKRMFQRALMFEKNNATANYYVSSIDKIMSDMGNEHFFRGVGYYQQKNYTRAKTEFEKAITLNPSLEEAQKYLKLAHEKIEEHNDRIARLLARARSLEQEKKFVEATNTCLRVLRLDKNNSKAKDMLSRLRPKTEQFVNSQFNEALRLFRDDDLKAAEELLVRVLSINPNHTSARNNLERLRQEIKTKISFHLAQADAYARQREWGRALSEYTNVLALDPTNKEALEGTNRMNTQLQVATLLSRAQSRLSNGNLMQAISDYESVLKLDPGNERARAELDAVHQQIQEQVEFHYNRGINLYTQDKYDDAISEFERVLSLDPEHQGAKDYIQQAEQRLTALKRIQPR